MKYETNYCHSNSVARSVFAAPLFFSSPKWDFTELIDRLFTVQVRKLCFFLLIPCNMKTKTTYKKNKDPILNPKSRVWYTVFHLSVPTWEIGYRFQHIVLTRFNWLQLLYLYPPTSCGEISVTVYCIRKPLSDTVVTVCYHIHHSLRPT